MTSQLEEYFQDINRHMTSNEQVAHVKKLREKINSMKQCLASCAQASQQAEQDRTHVFEDISIAENGDQLIVVPLGELIEARRITAGAGSKQWIGQMSDASLQQILRDYSRVAIEKPIE